jgi:replicative DNA helicase
LSHDKLIAAREYAQQGMRVLPCEPNGKVPLTDLVPHAVKDATTDSDKITEWWTRYPNANIGVAGGNGLLCIDFDFYKNSNAAKDLEKLIVEALPPTRTEATPGGGEHWFYLVPEEDGLAGVDPIKGVELRYTNRYVVVAPSSTLDEDDEIFYEVLNDGPLAKAPDGLLELLRNAPVSGEGVGVPDFEPLPTDHRYLWGTLDKMFAEKPLAEGPRYIRVKHLQRRLAEDEKFGDLTLGQIRTALWQYPPGLDKDRDHPGWLNAEFRRFIKKDWPTYQAQREAREAAKANQRPLWSAQFITGDTFALDVPEGVPAVWGEGDRVLWARGESLMLCGPQGVGKTTLVGQVAIARLGLSSAVLGLPVVPGGGRVLYLACDRPQQARRSLNRLMRPEWRTTLRDQLVVWQGPPPADFAKDTQLMAAMATEVGADTIIVDSLKDVAIGLKEDEVGASYNQARQIAVRAGIEVIELHHQTKSGGALGQAPTALSNVYGSVWITAGAGSVILLWGNAGDPVVDFKHLKQPLEEVGPFQVRHDHTNGTSDVYHETDLLTLVSSCADGITAKDAAKVVFNKENPSTAEVEKVRRRLAKLGLEERPGSRGGAATTYHAQRVNHET